VKQSRIWHSNWSCPGARGPSHPARDGIELPDRAGPSARRPSRPGTCAFLNGGALVDGPAICRATPTAEERWSGSRRDAETTWTGKRIDINTATQKELAALAGVGPTIARQIIEGRPYRWVEKLDLVKGIGKKRLEAIRPLVVVK